MRDDFPHDSTTDPPDYSILPGDYKTVRLIRYVIIFIEILLAFRFILKLLAANPSSFFAEIVYGLSFLLIVPFSGLFPSAATADTAVSHVFEASTVTAVIVYALIAWGATKLFIILHSKPKPRKKE